LFLLRSPAQTTTLKLPLRSTTRGGCGP
jgi:hypothetical protein